MTVKTIYLLSGWAGSGKDYIATTQFPHATRFAFGDVLKQQVSEASGLPLTYFNDRALKDTPLDTVFALTGDRVTPRDLLLNEARIARAFDKDVYAKVVLAQILGDVSSSVFVVTDWRYKREFEFLHTQLQLSQSSQLSDTSISYRIYKCRVVRKPKQTVAEVSNDETEHDLDNEPMDWVIVNSVTSKSEKQD